MKEPGIVEKALENLKNETGIRGKWYQGKEKDLDGALDLYFQNNNATHFILEVKRELRNHNIPELRRLANIYNQPLMVIAENIFPKIKEELRNQGIAYLETNGNIYVRNDQNFVWVEGAKAPVITKEKVNRAFTKTGLKVIFLFLQDDEFINKPYREIAQEAGVALGNVNYVMNGLRMEKFLAKKNKNELVLLNTKRLLDKWLADFDDKLKPTLHVGNFRFVNDTEFFNWKNLKLKTEATVWGGEPAGDLLTNYLRPEILTLYTTEARNELMRNYKLMPDDEGNVKVYKRFWNWKENITQQNFTPPLLTYTDLMNTGNQRCIDTAQKIYDQYLKDKF